MTGLTDMHTHTTISFDGLSSPLDMCRRADELGLLAHAVTDHIECNMWHEKAYYESLGIKTTDKKVYGMKDHFKKSLETIPALKERFPALIFGCELGEPHRDREVSDFIAKNKQIDFIIGSLHELKGMEDFYFSDFSAMTADELNKLLEQYFEELYELTLTGNFDVLGHLTYPLRYIAEADVPIPDMSNYSDKICEILKKVVSLGKGIEINSSGLFRKLGDTFPSLSILKLYRSLGGEILTVGSDAHCTENLGKGLDTAVSFAKAAGFDRLCRYKNRKPIFEKI